MKISKYMAEPYFEKNLGQLPREVKYKIKSNGYTTFFTEEKLVVSLPSNIENTINVFCMKLENTNRDIEIKGQNKQIGIVNYLIGTDESKWITNIPTYSKIKYKEIYKNIDLYYYINNNNLEYDFVLSKEANPKDISISFEGVDSIEIDAEKNISLSIGDVKAKLLKPEVYQIVDNKRTYVDCEYILDENSYIKFLVGEYEKEYDLVLDPIIILEDSTYIGSSGSDYVYAIDIDNNGSAYVTGRTTGYYPTTSGAYQTTFGKGSNDAFVTKLSRDGKTLIYSTYIGGSGNDSSNGIKVDGIGCAYIAGQTSGNYPTTSGAYQTKFGGYNDVFVTKLSRDGKSLIYSTYIGGSGNDYVRGIDIDSKDYVYVVGYTTGSYPTTTGAYQTTYAGGAYDSFVSKLNTDGSSLIYSTYIGGIGDEYAYGIAVDSEGYAYITGHTSSANYPITATAIQAKIAGKTDVFVSKISNDGSTLIYSTYLGGVGDDHGYGIAVDSEGYAYITGVTLSNNYPTTQGAYRTTYLLVDAFVSKISKNGSTLIYSTFLGGSSSDMGYGIKVDNKGCAYIVGQTQSIDFPTTSDAYQATLGGGIYDAFYTKLNEYGNELIYSTYLGGSGADIAYGIVIDILGGVYIAGQTQSVDFPTILGAYQTSYGGSFDVFITKLSSLGIDFTWGYCKDKVKLLDRVTLDLTVNNLSSATYDINLKYYSLDSSVSFIPNTLCIQGVTQSTTSIPEQIYISNILPRESRKVSFDLKYTNEKLLEKIPVTVEVEIYYNNAGTLVLAESREKIIYIDTAIGPNYIPGCNRELYNLGINGKVQTTDSGIPIVYYKSGTSYIYREPNGDSYVYKVLSSSSSIVEYKIS